jgi:choline dehydrogenase
VAQRRGFRHSAASAYLRPIRGRDNLEVRLGAIVERIAFDGARASGVHYRQRSSPRFVRARRGVVLSAGALGSPKILMLSGIGPGAALRSLELPVVRDLAGVGRNLQEHPGIIVSPHVNAPTLTSDLGPWAILREGWRYVWGGRGALSMPVGHAQAFVRTRPKLDAPNIQIIFSPSAYDHHEKGATPYTKPAATLAVGLCRVSSRGEIRLRSPQAQDLPIIDYALLDHEDDAQQLAEGVRFARRLYAAPSFAPYFRDERKPGSEFATDGALIDVIRRTSFLMYHPCGTCRMGRDAAAGAVVGPDLRVHGVERLWVADAAVMPTIPAGNINATCIMIGEKAADLVRAGN